MAYDPHESTCYIPQRYWYYTQPQWDNQQPVVWNYWWTDNNEILKALQEIKELLANDGKSVQTGWICPKCAKVYAPWVEGCQGCNDKKGDDY